MEKSLREERLRDDLLGLLLDGPASFAALYGGLVRHCGYPKNASLLSEMMSTLLKMERCEWVRTAQMSGDGLFREPTEDDYRRDLRAYQAWLPEARLDELAVDEVGLWLEITMKGRMEGKHRLIDERKSETGRWTLEDLADARTIIVRAETEEVAAEKIQEWISRNPAIELVDGSENVERIGDFELRDGTIIVGGVELSSCYRRVSN